MAADGDDSGRRIKRDQRRELILAPRSRDGRVSLALRLRAPLLVVLTLRFTAAPPAARRPGEARRWTADNAASTPFLTAEAAARGITVAALAAEVLAAVAAWTAIGAAIEAARMGAKVAIGLADSLPKLAAAAAIDWKAVVTPTAPTPTPAPTPEPTPTPASAPPSASQPAQGDDPSGGGS